ncbi:hypothetical protein [Roseateles depolymerans]|uniref:Uncharacterized protein n=1 Tax=Roseateles depolymerans TaxID=76731 RepID=A0A0U3MJI5_9BURK|nr:hypothetical protein [Roseateles depolymerans]ALV07692.1 hypothetical protein RD2015_3233 [Roseateles depolymerans]REG22085.1 hypothetical protein DES44_1228 [Roseateles depolymerans]
MTDGHAIRRWLRQLAMLLLSAAVIPATAAAEPQAPPLPEPLLHARFYAWGWVGTPAEQSSEERAARSLAKTWPAHQLVQALPQANAEGKLYMLCIIRRLHPSRYAGALREAGLPPDAPVSVFAGSVLQTLPARQLIDQLERSRCEPLTWPEARSAASAATRPPQ